MKKIAFGLIFAIMISGCHNRQALWMSDFSVGPEDVVAELEWLHLPSDSIGCPSMIVKVGDRIILSDSSNGYALKVYDMTNDSVMSMLRIGRAEDEVLNVHQMLSYGGNLGIFDNFTKKRWNNQLKSE